jgi:hypothetical protein
MVMNLRQGISLPINNITRYNSEYNGMDSMHGMQLYNRCMQKVTSMHNSCNTAVLKDFSSMEGVRKLGTRCKVPV